MAKANNNLSGSQPSEGVSSTEAFLSKYRKWLAVAVVALIVIVAGWYLYRTYVVAPRAVKASTALSVPQALFAEEAYEEAIEGFQKVISDYGGTKSANLARLYVGLCYANTNQWSEALPYLEKYSVADDAMVSPAAVSALAQAYANTGNVDKAIATLKKAASLADKRAVDGVNYSLSSTFLLQAAVLLESQSKDAEALALYKEIKAKYVNAQVVQSKEIDKYIYRLEEK